MRGAQVVEAVSRHTATLVFLHGLGDSGHGWAAGLSVLQRTLPGLRIVCPHAPARPVTLNGGAYMPAWYDIASLAGPAPEEAAAGRSRADDEAGLEASRAAVLRVLDEERARLPLGRIFLGGFSQGAALSLYTLLRAPSEKGRTPDATQLAGVVALSGYVPCQAVLARLLAGTAPAVPPVFVAHGTADAVVQLAWHAQSAAWLRDALGADARVDVRTYAGMGHTSVPAELRDVAAFLSSCLSAGDSKSEL